MAEMIKPVPHMDVEGLKCFQETVARSKCYLEYGCGGSTVFAATVAHVSTIISVDSDRDWSERVRASIEQENCMLHLEHCDIGEVGEWGNPKNRDNIYSFWKYMVTPWTIANRIGLAPDTVLIDGRFRVASFLFSLLSSRVGTWILFDDYLNRPHYFIAERFCQLAEKRGRMGIFITSKSFSISNICETIAQYSIVFD